MTKRLCLYSLKQSARHPAIANIITAYKHMPSSARKSHEVVVVGQTGYGKSALLRALTGYSYLSNDILACTRDAESVEFTLSEDDNKATLAFIDLPGIGENPKADTLFYELYREILSTATIILFVLRADKRDHSIDLEIYQKILLNASADIIFVITAVDKIEPINLHPGPMLTSAQESNLKIKLHAITNIFQTDIRSIRCVSTLFQQGIVSLMEAITRIILAVH